MSGQREGLSLQCRDADGEAMQNTCQEVQQHVLSKLGNLAAVCLPDCGPVTHVFSAFHSEPHLLLHLMLLPVTRAMHQHTPTALLANASTKLLDDGLAARAPA